MAHSQAQPRILVVRLGAMGDILHALPAVAALRTAHPGWRIGWAVEPRWRALLCADSYCEDRGRGPAMPLLDRVHLVSAKRWVRHLHQPSILSEVMAARRQIRKEHYDTALDLQGALRSAMVGLWSNAPRRVGEAKPREYPARFLFNERVATYSAHVIDQACEVASAVSGTELSAVLPPLPLDPEDESWCYRLLSSGQPLRRRLILMNPGAGWGAKRWPAERYGQVAAELHELGYSVFVNASPDEAELAGTLVEASGNSAIQLGCTLGQLIAVTRRASLMIGGDTGPLHLASALGKPVLGIFGPTDPVRNGPYKWNDSSSFQVLRNPASKRNHARRLEPEAGLLTITVPQVCEAALQLLRATETA